MILLHLFKNLRNTESWMLCPDPCLGAGNWRSYRRGPRTCPVPRAPRVVPCAPGPAGCALCRRHDALPFAAVCHVTGFQGLSCLRAVSSPSSLIVSLLSASKVWTVCPLVLSAQLSPSKVCPFSRVVSSISLSCLLSCPLQKFVLSTESTATWFVSPFLLLPSGSSNTTLAKKLKNTK